MKTRRLAKNTKALSPVIATIILVAVTVAIAIAVAAWLGALTFTYTRTEQITVTQVTLVAGTGTGAGQATFSLSNSGTSDVTLSTFLAQGGAISGSQSGTIVTTGTTCTGGLVLKGSACTLIISFSPATFASGTRYDFTLVSSQGNKFPTSAIA